MRRALLLPLLLMMLVVTSSCAFLKSIGRTLTVAGGGAAGAVAGLPLGPPGMVVGGGMGAGATYAALENSELRSGSLQGSEARDAELDRLKAFIIILQGEKTAKEIALGEVQHKFSEVVGDLAEKNRYWEDTKKLWRWILGIGMITRNLFNIPPFVRALMMQRWLRALHWLAHMIVWPWRPKE